MCISGIVTSTPQEGNHGLLNPLQMFPAKICSRRRVRRMRCLSRDQCSARHSCPTCNWRSEVPRVPPTTQIFRQKRYSTGVLASRVTTYDTGYFLNMKESRSRNNLFNVNKTFMIFTFENCTLYSSLFLSVHRY